MKILYSTFHMVSNIAKGFLSMSAIMTSAILFPGCSNDMDDLTTLENNMNVKFKKNAVSPLALEWETVVYSGQPVISTSKNQKVLMSNDANGGYGYGVYICDIATLYIDLSIPNPDEVVIKGIDDNRCGYYGNVANNSPKRGTIVNDRIVADGTKQRVLTYCYYIKSNSSGTPINQWVPCSPSNAKIVYKKGF